MSWHGTTLHILCSLSTAGSIAALGPVLVEHLMRHDLCVCPCDSLFGVGSWQATLCMCGHTGNGAVLHLACRHATRGRSVHPEAFCITYCAALPYNTSKRLGPLLNVSPDLSRSRQRRHDSPALGVHKISFTSSMFYPMFCLKSF